MIKETLRIINLFTFLLLFILSGPAAFAQTEFADFPWLEEILDSEDCCQNQSVTAYQSGIFTFLYIQKGPDCEAEGSELYFQDGTFYCFDINDLDCRAAYALTEENATLLWECEPSNMTGGCAALEKINLDETLCGQCIKEVATYNYQGVTYLVTVGDNEACSDAQTTVINCDSTVVFCYEGGIAGFNECEEFFKEAEKVEVKWSKEIDCQPNFAESCMPLEKVPLDENLCETCIGEISIYEFKGEFYLVTRENNPLCADGITSVINCDSTKSFCLEGGIAGFNQCEDFFKSAVLVETLWSIAEDCGTGGEIKFAEPCTDMAGVDFGLCEAIMGIGIVDGKCTTISGCLDFVVKGVDYSKAFFPTVEICAQTCGTGTIDLPEIFSEFAWLPEVVDLENCKGTTIEFYDTDTHFFIHIQTEDNGTLYFQDGTFYCQDLENYDCRALYGLTEKQLYETWLCLGDGFGLQPAETSISLPSQKVATKVLNAFPNPTNGLVQLQVIAADNTPQKIRVYNMYGQIIQQLEVRNGTNELDLSMEDAGIYFVEWGSGIEREVVKVVKQ